MPKFSYTVTREIVEVVTIILDSHDHLNLDDAVHEAVRAGEGIVTSQMTLGIDVLDKEVIDDE
jgi:hypothetical protein